ncbi:MULTISPECIES: hypothetical protein [Nostoc]|uniref:Uncharacterized protein n=1 Tax=Nostoc paludosum FACHB-159 TaxID=2692908 RepID=A0ABR8KE09_9NOSO|nr:MULTISPECIES: hypothetical protein [Nostoc]MBD2681316.1 hypothetical protein [Nostoc sp. FACHB-857]MBD2737795.1 hypothetical protein [Nostoc paludosum FACHB-159]
MKRIFTGILLALPLAMGALSSKASAEEIIVVPVAHRPFFIHHRFHHEFYPRHWERVRHDERLLRADLRRF